MEFLNIKFLNKTKGINNNRDNVNFIKTLLFGLMFSISWTPCVGSFLSSALMLVAKEQNIVKGIILICIYSLGLGIPFIISAILVNKLKETFDFIKKHYFCFKCHEAAPDDISGDFYYSFRRRLVRATISRKYSDEFSCQPYNLTTLLLHFAI